MYDTSISIKCGVPQSSILGPILFIIYTNDLCNVSELLYTIMYTDDTSVITSCNEMKSLIQSVNSELCLLKNTWLKANVTRRHKRAPMSGNSKHSKNNLKIYVIIFAMFLYGRWTNTIILFYIQLINHHTYYVQYPVI